AIDHDKLRTLRGLRLAASSGRGHVRGGLGEPIGVETAAVRRVLPALPTRRTELAGEVKALDMAGTFSALAAVMLGDQGRQGNRGALAVRCAIAHRPRIPSRKGGVEPGRADH